MWVLKLNEVPQGYFDQLDDAKHHAQKMLGTLQFSSEVDENGSYVATIPSRGNTKIEIQYEED